MEKSFDEIVEPLRKKAEELGLKKEDVEGIVHEYREEKLPEGFTPIDELD